MGVRSGVAVRAAALDEPVGVRVPAAVGVRPAPIDAAVGGNRDECGWGPRPPPPPPMLPPRRPAACIAAAYICI